MRIACLFLSSSHRRLRLGWLATIYRDVCTLSTAGCQGSFLCRRVGREEVRMHRRKPRERSVFAAKIHPQLPPVLVDTEVEHGGVYWKG